MQTYETETVITEEGILEIKGVPFNSGDMVEVIITKKSSGNTESDVYPLRGKPISYEKPFDSVAEKDWEVIK